MSPIRSLRVEGQYAQIQGQSVPINCQQTQGRFPNTDEADNRPESTVGPSNQRFAKPSHDQLKIVISLVRKWVYVHGCNLESVLIHVLITTMNFKSEEESHEMEERH